MIPIWFPSGSITLTSLARIFRLTLILSDRSARLGLFGTAMFAPPVLELLSGILQVRICPLNINAALEYGLKRFAPVNPLTLEI
jgi:hypothetical protein